MYFLLYGEDTYRSRKTLVRMEAKFRADRDATGMNAARIAAKGTTVDDVAAVVFATPFLAEKKLVVLDGFLKASKDLQEAVVGFLERKPDSTTIIFYEEGSAEDFKKSALFSVLKDVEYTTEHAALSPVQAQKLVTETCRELGLSISSRAAQDFVAAVGKLSWQRETELEKLCAYAAATGAKEIDGQMIRDLVPTAQEEDMFAFIDACLAGKAKDSIVLLEAMLASGASEIQVVAMLSKHFRNLVAIRDCMDRGIMDKHLVAKEVGMHQFPAGKAIQACRRFSSEEVRALHAQVLDVDRALKTTSGKSKILLETFVVRLATTA